MGDTTMLSPLSFPNSRRSATEYLEDLTADKVSHTTTPTARLIKSDIVTKDGRFTCGSLSYQGQQLTKGPKARIAKSSNGHDTTVRKKHSGRAAILSPQTPT